MFLIVAIGVYPRPIFEQIQPAVQLISRNVQIQRDRAREREKAALDPTPRSRRGGSGAPTTKGKASSSGKSSPKGQ
jgi:hypothetical protein